MSHTGTAINAFEEIPPAKRRYKWVKSVIGGLIFIGAWFLPWLGFPAFASYIVAGFGGFLVSEDLTRKFLKLVPAVIRDVRDALKGNGK